MTRTTLALSLTAWAALTAGCVPPPGSAATSPLATAAPAAPPKVVAAAPQPTAAATPAPAPEPAPAEPPPPPREAAAAPKETPEPPARKDTGPRVIQRARRTTAFLVFSPNGKTIGLDGDNDSVELWDAQTAQRQATLRGHSRNVKCADFDPAGKVLAVGSYKQIKLWDVASAQELRTIKGQGEQVNFLYFTPDGGKLVAGYFNNTAKVWDVATGRELASAADLGGNGLNSKLSPDRKRVAVWGGGILLLLDTATLERQKFESFAEFFQAVSFAADGKSFLAGCAENLKLFDVDAREGRLLHKDHTDWVTSVSLSADGQLAASGSKDKTAILWDVKAGKERATITGYSKPVRVRLFPDGKLLATWSDNEPAVRLWDVATGLEGPALRGHTAGVSGVFFSRDGKTVAVPGADGKVLLWDVANLPQ